MGERLVEFEWWGGTENCTRHCFGNGHCRDYVTRRSVFQVLFIQILLDEWIFLIRTHVGIGSRIVRDGGEFLGARNKGCRQRT